MNIYWAVVAALTLIMLIRISGLLSMLLLRVVQLVELLSLLAQTQERLALRTWRPEKPVQHDDGN